MSPAKKPAPLRMSELITPRNSRGGLCCPGCGCPDFRVKVTWRSGGAIRRARICRSCGKRWTSSERFD